MRIGELPVDNWAVWFNCAKAREWVLCFAVDTLFVWLITIPKVYILLKLALVWSVCTLLHLTLTVEIVKPTRARNRPVAHYDAHFVLADTQAACTSCKPAEMYCWRLVSSPTFWFVLPPLWWLSIANGWLLETLTRS